MFTLAVENNEAILVSLAIGGGLIIVVLGIIMGTWRRVAIERAREESRREIAAYVAEGTMSADDAAKLLAAGASIGDAIKRSLGKI